MNTTMHGRKIAAVYWPDTDSERGRSIEAERDGVSIALSATHHGDHDEFWIVVSRDGAEVARHNPRYVESFLWLNGG